MKKKVQKPTKQEITEENRKFKAFLDAWPEKFYTAEQAVMTYGIYKKRLT